MPTYLPSPVSQSVARLMSKADILQDLSKSLGLEMQGIVYNQGQSHAQEVYDRFGTKAPALLGLLALVATGHNVLERLKKEQDIEPEYLSALHECSVAVQALPLPWNPSSPLPTKVLEDGTVLVENLPVIPENNDEEE